MMVGCIKAGAYTWVIVVKKYTWANIYWLKEFLVLEASNLLERCKMQRRNLQLGINKLKFMPTRLPESKTDREIYKTEPSEQNIATKGLFIAI